MGTSSAGWRGLHGKVLFQSMLFSVPLLLFAILSVQHIRGVSRDIDALYDRSSAVAITLREALAKLAEANYHARNNDRVRFENSSEHFDLLMKAMAWGTDSQVFRRDSGGKLYEKWRQLGWEGSIGSVQTSERMRQFAGETTLYHRGFTKYMLQAMEAHSHAHSGEHAHTEGGLFEKANRYENLVIQNLRSLMDEITKSVVERRSRIRELQFRNLSFLFLIALALFLIVAVTSWTLSHKDIVRPVTHLIRQVEKVSTGDLSAKLPVTSKDEIGELARAFNRMTEDLQKVSISRDYLNSILDASPNGFALTDEKGGNVYSNPAFLKMLGLKENEIRGHEWVKRIHPEDRDRVLSLWQTTLDSKGRYDTEQRYLRGDTVVWTRTVGAPVLEGDRLKGYVFTVEDITKQKRLESAMRQSEKMAAVGQLAGGIAHDLNNGLTPVMGYLDMLLLDAPESDKNLRTLLNEAKQSTQRCIEVVRKLVGFSRPTTQAKTEVAVEKLLSEFKKLAHTLLPSTIELDVQCAPDIGSVLGNESDLMSVLVNLAVNAKDAMNSEGKLSISASCVASDALRLRGPDGDIFDRDHVLIAVTDTGKGIPAQMVSRVFEPFFTTKPKGKGTGLGLAMVYNTIKDHEGWIEVSSAEGQGTTFRMFIPYAAGASCPLPNSKAAQDGADMPRGEGTILFVDDEEMMRSMGKNFLERSGYRVILAHDGEEAVEMFQKHRADIRAVVMDVTMPKVSGIEAMKKMLAIDPKARIVLASGYTSDGTPAEMVRAGAAAFLGKPYTIAPLLQTVQAALRLA